MTPNTTTGTGDAPAELEEQRRKLVELHNAIDAARYCGGGYGAPAPFVADPTPVATTPRLDEPEGPSGEGVLAPAIGIMIAAAAGLATGVALVCTYVAITS